MAEKWQKFSKSKWNAFDPEDLINQRWADAIRYWTAWSQLWKDILFEENEIKNGQKLITKLWNASNFVQMLTQWFDPKQKFDTNKLLATDQRIIARTNETIEKMTKYLDKFEYGLAKIAFEEFFWADFCDNYLELVKLRLYKPELFENGEEKKLAWQWTLYHILFDTLKLIAPYLPHITEEIYQNYFKQYENIISIHKTEFPTQILEINNQAEQIKEFEKIKEIIESVRKFKTENQISMWAELKSLDIHWSKEFLEIARKYLDDIIWVTKAQKVDLIESNEENFICSKL